MTLDPKDQIPRSLRPVFLAHFFLHVRGSIGGHRRSALLGPRCPCMLDAACVWWQHAIVHHGRSVFPGVAYLLTCICYFAWSRGLRICIRLSTIYTSYIVVHFFHLDVVDLFSPVNIEWQRAHPKAGPLAQFFLEIHGLPGGRQRSGRLGSPCLVLPLGTCYIQSIEGVALLSRSRRPRDLYAVFCCFSSSPDHSPNECRQAAPACQPIGMSVEAGHVARISVLPICPCQLECVPACESSSPGLHFDVYAQAV